MRSEKDGIGLLAKLEFKYKNVLKFQEGLTGKMDKTIAVDRVLQTDYISNLFFRVLSNGFATRVGKSAFN